MKHIEGYTLAIISSLVVGGLSGYQFAAYRVNSVLEETMGELDALVQDIDEGGGVGFECLQLSDPEALEGALVFDVENQCEQEVTFVEWSVSSYEVGTDNMVDSQPLIFVSIPAGKTAQEKLLIELPAGIQFDWEAIPSTAY